MAYTLRGLSSHYAERKRRTYRDAAAVSGPVLTVDAAAVADSVDVVAAAAAAGALYDDDYYDDDCEDAGGWQVAVAGCETWGADDSSSCPS